MRKAITGIFCLLLTVTVLAQKKKTPVATSSPKYITQASADSLLRSESFSIFKQQGIPESYFYRYYPSVKKTLEMQAQQTIQQDLKQLEATIKKNKLTADSITAGAAQKQYTELFRKAINRAWNNNAVLSRYIDFDKADHIKYFSSTVSPQPDGKLFVTEKITIYNGNGSINPLYGDNDSIRMMGGYNNDIKRGLVRTLPLVYTNKYKLFQNTTITIKEVLRDGKKEPYHAKKEANGLVIYFGQSSVYIPEGTYTYTLSYETNYQLKFLKDFDELYWNVTGSSWPYRIDSAACTIILPEGASMLSSKCYTGIHGSTAEECTLSNKKSNGRQSALFKTNRFLLPKEGLTASVSWPKGFVQSPGSWQMTKHFIWNNKAVFLLPLAALFSLVYCFIMWWLHGRDPKGGTVYPLFEPPAEYSPAELGYIYFQEFSGQLVAATIVDAAVRNKIKVEVERDGWLFKHNEYIIKKADKAGKTKTPAYNDFYRDVIDLVDSRIEKGKYNSSLGDLSKRIQEHCIDTYQNKKKKKGVKGFFSLNNNYNAVPQLICFLVFMWALIELLRSIILKNYWQIGYFVAGTILCTVIFKIFDKLMRAYNKEGRKMRDTIEGFRMFLATADEKRFDMMSPPKKTLELYEKYLPFAIALNCEVEWGNKFESIIDTASIDKSAISSFSHTSSSHRDSFGSSFASSFSGAISSASSPPGSSSGGGSSFGGGSSGGGGGGGGGGGW